MRANGQALVEFALVGSLALLALALLIQIGLRMNYQQELEQQTFRRALQVAQSEGDDESSSILYLHLRDRQVPDPSQAFALMPRVTTNANSAITWGERLLRRTPPESRIVVQLNNAPPQEIHEDGLVGDEPLIKRIKKTLQARGTVRQTNLGSSLRTTTTETTTMTLPNNDAVSSTLPSNVDFRW